MPLLLVHRREHPGATRRSAHYQFIRSNGKVTAVRADFVSVNTVLTRQ